ncbi:MAG: phosphatase PAP2 family protein [Acetatifactor sp.]|nr:phosphatase PAP2 family protein [Acetatifactor sp.]
MLLAAGNEFYFQWEIDLLNWFQGLHSPMADKFWSFITKFGDGGIFWILLTLVVLIFVKDKRIGWTMFGALVIDVLVCNIILKNAVQRSRPCWVFPDVLMVNGVEIPDDFSFPSGHTGASFAAAVAIFLRNKKWGIPAVILAALVAVSRLYLFVHFPTDVLGGLVVGVVGAVCSFLIVNAFYKNKDEHKFLPFFGQPL